MDLGLRNRTVLVTGASGGIGSQIVLQFADEGANVVIHYHQNREAAEALAEKVGQANSLVLGGPLNDEVTVKAVFDEAASQFGRVDILVANAGIWPSDHQSIHEMSLERWRETLDTNLTSVFLCCRQFIKQVKSHHIPDPSIVLIGSTAAIFGEAGHSDYSASKSAMTHGLMLSLKNELVQVAPRGRVNTVCPGWTITPMTEKFAEDPLAIERALSTVAMKKVATTNDIANAVLFLSSPSVAGHITGQVLTVSGGMEGRKLNEPD